MAKTKQKCPYMAYTLDEVLEMESSYFVIRFGGDFTLEDDHYTFGKPEATALYKKMFADLVDIARNGSVKDSKYALELMATMSIQPMRLH